MGIMDFFFFFFFPVLFCFVHVVGCVSFTLISTTLISRSQIYWDSRAPAWVWPTCLNIKVIQVKLLLKSLPAQYHHGFGI